MKKVLAATTKYIFAAFGVAILGLLMSLTYQALERIFPDSFANQIWGLVLFDIAAICWALAFVFHSKSTGQYAASVIGFLTGFLGTLVMVAAEVMLSSTDLTGNTDTTKIGQWLVYGFIIATVLHAALVYAHHATSPEIHEQINVGVARGEIVTEAIKKATYQLDVNKSELAYSIEQGIVSQVKRDLGLQPVEGTLFDRRHMSYPWLPGQEPAPSPIDHNSEYALPCGHNKGARWDKGRQAFACVVCNEAFNPNSAQKEDYTGIAPELYAPGTRFTDPKDQARHDDYHDLPGKSEQDKAAKPKIPFRPE